MNKTFWRRAAPHIIAVGVFLVIAVIYCRPALEGKVVNQQDITQWKGAIHQSEEYAKTHNGKYPLWTNSMFSGMPTFQIGGIQASFIVAYVHPFLTLGLPKPIQFFFLACICFYFLCCILRINPYLSILGSLAFAYATYNPVIISAGHDTKMLSIAYMPALLGSIILIYEKRYLLGGVLTAIFTSILVAQNHVQIAYYFFLVIAIMTLFYIIRWIRNKEWKHLVAAGSIAIAFAAVGVLSNSEGLFSTYEYQKETIRGGESSLAEPSKNSKAQTGLDKDYAFSYSLKLTEPLVMVVPRMYGGSTDKEEVDPEESKAIEALQSLPQDLQQQLPMTYYWGGLIETGGSTSGPPYIGAVIFFLALLAMFVLDNTHKWWILVAVAFAILMSTGSYLEGFNDVFYNHLPFYNKFRAPSMILVIPQLLLPMLAILGMNAIVNAENKKSLLPAFKKALLATSAFIVLLLLLYISFDFLSKGDKSLLKQVRGMNQPQLSEAVNSFFTGLKDDRKSLMLGDIFRTLGFIIATAALVFFTLRQSIKPIVAIIGLTVLALFDVMPVNSTYLNSDSFQDPEENLQVFQKTKADEAILADRSYFRVFNFSGNAFQDAITSYHYNSVGGYHAAKLRIYADLIERQLGKQQPNFTVLNMLNAKYFIQKDRNGQTQNFQQNEQALGPCWFVKHIQYVKDARAEMAALDSLKNPKDTAIVQESFKGFISFTPATIGDAVIRLVKNDNDIVTYASQSTANGFAVFSEIFYKAGWKAFVDGKEAPIIKVNYVLRGLALPPGSHNIEFRFEPSSYIAGKKLTAIFSWLMLGLIIIAIFAEWNKRRRVIKQTKQ